MCWYVRVRESVPMRACACVCACARAREMEEGCIVIPIVLSLQYPLPTLFTDVSFVVTSFLG